MKRIILGTVALLGALAVVAVKLPSVLVDPRFGGYSAVSSKGCPLVLSQDLKAVTPLLVTKGVPSLPPLEPGSLDSHSSADDSEKVTGAQEAPGLREADAPQQESPRLAGTRLAPASHNESDAANPSAVNSGEAANFDESDAGAYNRTEARASNEIDAVGARAGTSGAPVEIPPSVPPAHTELARLLPEPPEGTSTTPPGETSTTLAGMASPGLTVASAAQAPRELAESRGPQSMPAVNPRQQSLRDTGEAGKPRAGFVLLDVAMKRHPLWGELAALEQEMEACKADWQRQVDASHVTEDDIAACYEAGAKALANGTAKGREIVQASASIYADALEKELQDIEARLEEEATRRIEARASEVRAKLDDDLYAERGRLNQEFDTFKEKAFKEYYLSLFNIQMKLKLLKLSEAERKALQEKLAKLTAEMQVKIEAKQREVDAAFAAYAEKRRAEAEAEIEEFRTDQERDVSLKLKEEQARLEKGLRDRLLAMDLSLRADAEKWREEAVRRAKIELSARREQIAGEFAAKEAAFTAKWEKLKARRDEIYARIRDDVRKAAHEVERDKGIKVTVLESSEPTGARATPDGYDLTEQVLKVIRDR
ncbi:MAG: hypothetical protein AB1700_05955 [Bacillota bacterium]